jgi:uncharacterized SAM-binding protein YcdF (DUF218 family)
MANEQGGNNSIEAQRDAVGSIPTSEDFFIERLEAILNEDNERNAEKSQPEEEPGEEVTENPKTPINIVAEPVKPEPPKDPIDTFKKIVKEYEEINLDQAEHKRIADELKLKYPIREINALCAELEPRKGKYDDAIIVLCGGTVPAAEDKSKTFFTARMRMYAGVISYYDALEQGKSPLLIATGGAQDEHGATEADVMKSEFLKYGIPKDRIVAEGQSFDTSTEAGYCARILETLGFLEKGQVELITNSFHIGRSMDTFTKHYTGKIAPVKAEEVLVSKGDRFRLPRDRDNHPYGTFADRFLKSPTNLEWAVRDYALRVIAKVPGGQEFLVKLAHSIRMEK